MNVKEIVSKLNGVVETSNGWEALCPAHDDAKPSLSIGMDDDKILLFCHAGCRTEQVVQALGLRMRDLFTNTEEAQSTVAYDYRDEKGQLLYRIVRRYPKSFNARRPDGNGGWISDLEEVRRIPYRLPDILEREKIFVVEGEKDADTLHDKFKLAATTNVFGAGKWRTDYNVFFSGKRVYLIPDADEAGEAHMRAVATSLFGVAEKIKILRLPFGKDASEFYALGGTREQLAKLAKESPAATAEQVREWKKTILPENGLQFKPLGELMRQPTEKRRWVVEGLLPVGGTSLLAAKPKVGKSTFARCLAFAVARGEEFLGRKTKQGAVLYLAPQELESEVKEHFKSLGATGSEPIHVCCRVDSTFALNDLEHLIGKETRICILRRQRNLRRSETQQQVNH